MVHHTERAPCRTLQTPGRARFTGRSDTRASRSLGSISKVNRIGQNRAESTRGRKEGAVTTDSVYVSIRRSWQKTHLGSEPAGVEGTWRGRTQLSEQAGGQPGLVQVQPGPASGTARSGPLCALPLLTIQGRQEVEEGMDVKEAAEHTGLCLPRLQRGHRGGRNPRGSLH